MRSLVTAEHAQGSGGASWEGRRSDPRIHRRPSPGRAILGQVRSHWFLSSRGEFYFLLTTEGHDPFVLTYLNRLSDWLFAVARAENAVAGVPDIQWVPRD